MNFPGVIAGDPEMLARIATAGQPPGRRSCARARRGAPLDAYLAAGVESDHECTELAEAEEKRRKGMWIFIRQGSASQNLRDLIPTVLAHGTDHVALCSDDREPDTLLEAGHLNDCVPLAVAAGVSEIDALVMATLNPAEYHGFTELGAARARATRPTSCASTRWRVPPLAGLPARAAWWPRDGAVVPGAVPDLRPRTSCAARSTSPRRPRPRPSTSACRPGARARTIGIETGSLTTRSLVTDPSDPASGVRPPGRGRAASGDRPDRAGLGARLRPHSGRAGLDRRPRCPQLHGRSGAGTPTVRPAMAAAVARLADARRRPGGGRRRRPGAGRAGPAHRRPHERPAGPVVADRAAPPGRAPPARWGRRSRAPSCS